MISLVFPLLLVLLAGCDKSPSERVKSVGSGGTGSFGAAPAYVIFSSELISGGGAFLYPLDTGQSLTFKDRSNPISQRSIRYSWTGERVDGQHNFCGFTLMHTATQPEYDSTPGRDLRQAGYTKVKFYARGTLSTNTLAKIEVADDGTDATVNLSCVSLSPNGTLDDGVNPGSFACGRKDSLSSDWKQFTVPIANLPAALASIKDFFKVTYVFNDPFPGNTVPGQGGTIYVDQIQYEP